MKLNYDSILKDIKKSIRKYLGGDRPVGLAISYFNPAIGAYWASGGNYIVLNGNIISAMNAVGRSQREKEALVRVLLMHEYIHSLGYEDELVTRNLTNNIIGREVGIDSLEFKISSEGPWKVFPFITEYPWKSGNNISVVSNFDSDNTDYIV